jgi:hypothetical protein
VPAAFHSLHGGSQHLGLLPLLLLLLLLVVAQY